MVWDGHFGAIEAYDAARHMGARRVARITIDRGKRRIEVDTVV